MQKFSKLVQAQRLIENFNKKTPKHHARLWDVTLGEVNKYIGELIAAQDLISYEKGREDERSKICGELLEKGDHDQGDFFIRQDLFDKIFNQN